MKKNLQHYREKQRILERILTRDMWKLETAAKYNNSAVPHIFAKKTYMR